MEAIFCTFQSTKNCKCLKTGELLKNVNPTHGTTIFTHQSSFLAISSTYEIFNIISRDTSII